MRGAVNAVGGVAGGGESGGESGGGSMQIRVLGPVEVLVDGHARPLPAAGERELLALLALAAGRVVALPALIDALWGEQLPSNPGNALQVRVSKLRRALTAAGVG